jgi:hypothetical protein
VLSSIRRITIITNLAQEKQNSNKDLSKAKTDPTVLVILYSRSESPLSSSATLKHSVDYPKETLIKDDAEESTNTEEYEKIKEKEMICHCTICFDDFPRSSLCHPLGCSYHENHLFCYSCLTRSILFQVKGSNDTMANQIPTCPLATGKKRRLWL